MNEPLNTRVHRILQQHNVGSVELLIVAVSGGMDSMSLLHACHRLGFKCLAAHVNYGLRGEESNADEALVRSFCVINNIPVEVRTIDASTWHSDDGSNGGVQEIARQLRYDWLRELLVKHEARFVLTAHHANDQTETMLYQFIRGGAGKSVYGMPVLANGVLRPLLSVTREEIAHYVAEHRIPWRNDASNDSDKYTRNRIRRHAMPIVESINPSIHRTIQQRSQWMHEEQAMVAQQANEFFKENVQVDGDAELLSIPTLIMSGCMHVLIWRWLAEKEFTSQQVQQIAEHIRAAAHAEPAWFVSPTHELCVQGETLALIACIEQETHVIDALPANVADMKFDECTRSEVAFTNDSERQYVSMDDLQFPLILRPWESGDRFHPLGATGSQKVSDFLTHAKMPAWKKKRVCVLESGGVIVAIPGARIGNHYKISDATHRCLRIQFRPK
jgi:tRNA(Ile)-lysidine synthase